MPNFAYNAAETLETTYHKQKMMDIQEIEIEKKEGKDFAEDSYNLQFKNLQLLQFTNLQEEIRDNRNAKYVNENYRSRD